MPLISIFWGFIVPSGVILYWTTSNLVQIGQQHFLLRAGKREVPTAGGDGAKRPSAATGSTKGAPDGRKPATPAQTPRPAPAAARRGFFASMLERAEAERARRQGQAPPRAQAQPPSQAEPQKSSESSDGQGARSQSPPQQRPGGQGARSRRKRRKR
jgi:hypothetical protein